MRLLRGLSFHWGWFLRYKLSQPQHRHPSWARHPSSPARPETPDTEPAISRRPRSSTTQFARRPLRDIQHTHYHPQIVVVRVVSRCATGCREPHTYSADASPSSHTHPLSSPSLAARPARPPSAPHRSSIASASPRVRAKPDTDETFPGRSLNSNYGAVFETD